MLVLLAGIGWAALVLYLLCRAIRQGRAFRAAAPAPAGGTAPLPSVTVIIPARDEAENIGPCLAALCAQAGIGDRLAIIVVDDDSQDGTAGAVRALARTDARITLWSPGTLPPGWTGKPHACWQGALRAEGEWLCFIDADVRAAPDLLVRVLRTVQRDPADMVSLYPFQELGSFWERLVIPAGLLMLACVKDLRGAGDPSCPDVTVNGQVLLARRAAYLAVGGHAAVHHEICEDRALALRLKREGFRFRLLEGEALATTRMYRSLPALWEGFGRNAVEILGHPGRTIAVAAGGLAVSWAAPVLPPLLFVLSAGFGLPELLGLALAAIGSAAVFGLQIGTARHFRAPFWYGLLMPLGFTLAAMLAGQSIALRAAGRVTWKGRAYLVRHKAS